MMANELVIVTDWLVVELTPLKNMEVNWDDEIPDVWKKNVPKHQPAVGFFGKSLGNPIDSRFSGESPTVSSNSSVGCSEIAEKTCGKLQGECEHHRENHEENGRTAGSSLVLMGNDGKRLELNGEMFHGQRPRNP